MAMEKELGEQAGAEGRDWGLGADGSGFPTEQQKV